MSSCHGFARISLHILRFLCAKWDIAGLEETWDEGEKDEKEEMDLEKVKGVAFSSASMNFFCPDLEACYEGLGDMDSDYPLFSVFHQTGLPLVASGDGFHDAGFRMLRESGG